MAITIGFLFMLALLCLALELDLRTHARPGRERGVTRTRVPSPAALEALPPTPPEELAAQDEEADLTRQLLTGTIDARTYRQAMDQLAHAGPDKTQLP